MNPSFASGIRCENLSLSYGRIRVVHEASLHLRPGSVTALVGPNGSGKSTALRALARLHRVEDGAVHMLDGDDAIDAASFTPAAFARAVAMLSQARPHPSGLAVRDIVAFGRHPHRRRFAGLTDEDREAIERALRLAGLSDMTGRPVDELSGGELQRVWIATALAQRTGILLLDEPTNHLDLRYQVETLDLVCDLADEGTCIGIVLHDLDQAAAIADEVVLMHRGRVRMAGAPQDVLTAEHLSEVYGLPVETSTDPVTGRIRVTPLGRHLGLRVAAAPSMSL